MARSITQNIRSLQFLSREQWTSRDELPWTHKDEVLSIQRMKLESLKACRLTRARLQTALSLVFGVNAQACMKTMFYFP